MNTTANATAVNEVVSFMRQQGGHVHMKLITLWLRVSKGLKLHDIRLAMRHLIDTDRARVMHPDRLILTEEVER